MLSHRNIFGTTHTDSHLGQMINLISQIHRLLIIIVIIVIDHYYQLSLRSILI